MTLRALRGSRSLSLLFGAVLLARLLTAPEAGPWRWLTNPTYRAEVIAKAEIADLEIERVRRLPGTLVCSMQNICYLAGRPFVFNDFTVEQRLLTGRAQKEDIDKKARSLRFEAIDPRAHWGP